MFSEKVLNITLGVSLLIHLILLAQNPSIILFSNQPRKNRMQVVYLKRTPQAESEFQIKSGGQRKPPDMAVDDAFLKFPNNLKITADKFSVETEVSKSYKEMDKRQMPIKGKSFIERLAFNKPNIAIKPDVIAIKRRVVLPPIDSEKLNSPTYISYYQLVREKIRRAAYRNYAQTETGEVYVSFVVSSNGEVIDNKLLEERSSPSQYLRNISLRSIRDAAPFPAFPKELNYPKLSFNVIISYALE